MLKKFTIFTSIIFITVLALFVGCSKEESKAEKQIKLGITIYSYSDNFLSFMRRNIESMLKDKASFIVNDSENDQAKQYDQIDAAIQRKVDALAINLVDPMSANMVIDKAKKAGIPVVFFNIEPRLEHIMSYDRVWYVGTKSRESGDIQGEMVLNAWKSNSKWDKNNDGKIQYVLLKGLAGHPDTEEEQIKTEISRVEHTNIGANKEVQTLLESYNSTPLKSGTTLAELIRRPELSYEAIKPLDKERPELPWDVQEQVDINIKYDGYIRRQLKQVEQFKKLEAKKIPTDLDYEKVGSLRIEARQKLEAYRPISIGQASRISGVSPADISVLLVYLSSTK